jgi:lysine 2-monooxygenase
MTHQTENTEEISDVLIVGGGISGLFAAWRLLNSGQNLSVTVVEKRGQVGGRLETTFVDIKDKNGKKYTIHDEEGGMRFVPEGQGMEHLWKLILDLRKTGAKLKDVPFVMGNKNNRYYIRGKSFTQDDVTKSNNDIWATLYNLAPGERGKNPSDILGDVMHDILHQNNIKSPSTPDDWIQFRNNCTYKDFDGNPVPINKWGFWSILRRYGLTGECIEMLSHVFGFMGPFQDFINAGEGLQILFDFPNPRDTPFRTLADGFQALPKALAASVQKAGGKIVLEETITSLHKQGDRYSASGQQTSYTAEQVILAIPKKPLKLLIQNSEVLSSNKRFTDAVGSVQNMELTKTGLYFRERWWHENDNINITNGPNFTDLPLGSVYCFSQYPDDEKKDADYNGPAALTQYTDYIRGNFWKELQNIGEKYQTKEFPENPEGTYPASRSLVTEIMKQIKLVFGLDASDTSIPMPVLSTYRVWGQDPFGYGYHQYKINVDDLKEVYPNIYNPAKNVYVCNESWSPEQGWVEGALMMSDLVLVKGFNVDPYASDKGYDLSSLTEGIPSS